MAKPQRKFLLILLTALTCLPGRVNFRNLVRYSPLNEKAFSRGFRRPFDFVVFNLLCLKALLDKGEWVVAIDASFARKSGCASYGLDWFWNGSQGRAERGLENVPATKASVASAKRTLESFSELTVGLNYTDKTARPFEEMAVLADTAATWRGVAKIVNDPQGIILYSGAV